MVCLVKITFGLNLLEVLVIKIVKMVLNGFDLKTYGLGFGADTEIKDNSKLGLALFYTNGSVDTNGVSQKADLDVYTALVYGNVPYYWW